MKSTATVILYNGGAYGSYLQWLIYSMTVNYPVVDPLTSKGTSHNFTKLLDQSDMTQIGSFMLDDFFKMSCQDIPSITKLHPKNAKYKNLKQNVNNILDRVERCIILYPDKNSYLLAINNYVYKIWDNIWSGALKNLNPADLYTRFQLDPGTDLNQMPDWVAREFLSYNLFSSWEDQVEWYFPDQFQDYRCLYVYINDLLFDPVNTLQKLKEFMCYTYVRPFKDILPLHEKNKSLQLYITQDSIANNIVQNVLNNQCYDWSDQLVTLVTEAYVQRTLRDIGYEVRCHDLNIFPTNSADLRELLYESV